MWSKHGSRICVVQVNAVCCEPDMFGAGHYGGAVSHADVGRCRSVRSVTMWAVSESHKIGCSLISAASRDNILYGYGCL